MTTTMNPQDWSHGGFAMQNRRHGEPQPVLAGVRAEGRLDGALFELTLRQTYRNPGAQVLEVVYTFPLPHQAVLLGFASELNGQRQQGQILARPQATARYEAGLAEGDAPVLLEAHANGLHTANIGNLKPGEELVIELRYAQLLALEQGRLRIAIPTTICPRYGDALRAGLEPQQVPVSSLTAEHPLALAIVIRDALALASVDCPTHHFRRQIDGRALHLELTGPARLDRDVVIVVEPAQAQSSWVTLARDRSRPGAPTVDDAEAPVVALAALQLPPGARRERIALKLLLDCSGSMAGDSIGSAKAVLRGALEALGAQDQLSLSRFGTTVEHLRPLAPCTPQALRQLRLQVDNLNADLGGTEMAAALQSVIALHGGETGPGTPAADILLVTDGAIWGHQDVLAAAQASGHRVFAIGVGHAPAESALRALAEGTGGACEFATPGEALEAAGARMLQRIRQQGWNRLALDWGQAPLWQSALPVCAHGGDTLMVFAGLRPQHQRAITARLLATDLRGEQVEVVRSLSTSLTDADTLPRIAAARRLVGATPEEALSLGLQYQLMGPQTQCVLVHERAANDKVEVQAQLHRVQPMVAAGWAGSGGVAESTRCRFAGPARRAAIRPAPDLDGMTVERFAALDLEAISRGRGGSGGSGGAGELPPEASSLRRARLVRIVSRRLGPGGEPLAALQDMSSLYELPPEVSQLLQELAALGVKEAEAWLLLALWHHRQAARPDIYMIALLQAQLDRLDPQLPAISAAALQRLMPAPAVTEPTADRKERLRRALRR